MKLETLPNRNLKISLDDADDRTLVRELLTCHGGDDVAFMADLLEQTGWQPNGQLHMLYPESVGALTCAPIVTDEVGYSDDGDINYVGDVWWYPGYELKHFGEVLLAEGVVRFHFAPPVREDVACLA